ncbi:TetR/AcrR family transcriptional regulator [Pseudonocardia tropica]|uniref:TetR/AcrR family transcriptional regulator n=1 Tax=Pseudonocardia tropica TaxID=681289 RepID=A0ABV1K2N1_9PSEU
MTGDCGVGGRRRPRADARRNRQRLLAEADAVFREDGSGASLERVARRAGVAIGTLYGHFPTRHDLVAALLRRRHDELFAWGEGLGAERGPGAALEAWVRAVVEHASTYSGLADLLVAADAGSELHDDCARMTAIGEALVAGARAAGAVRADIRGEDVFTLVNAAAWTRAGLSPEDADRLVTFTLDGFRRG